MRRLTGIFAGLLMAGASLFPAAAQSAWDYVLNPALERVVIPRAYIPRETVGYIGGEKPFFSAPEDLFIADTGMIYVVDTGNSRIVRMDAEFQVTGIFSGGESPLNRPRGIYVDDFGDMFIADTGNNRIVHLCSQGNFVDEFTRPDSELLSDEYEFKPVKVYMDPIGYLYIINENDYHGFITLDAHNRFRGYVAPTRLHFDVTQLLINTFASREQRERLSRRIPPYHSNFLIHDDGFVYAVTVFTDREQIKRINSVGVNSYTSRTQFADSLFGIDIGYYSYFGEQVDRNNQPIVPMFVDLHVDANGIISAVDAATQRIYQYDQEGRNLAVFGGRGTRTGEFGSVSSIAGDGQGNLYVLDREYGNIQVLEPTRFISMVHQGIHLQYQGRYEEAMIPWEEVLTIAPNYFAARTAMGKIYAKQGQWELSMDAYREGDDRSGYSEAFAKYRHGVFRENFLLTVLGIALAVTAGGLLFGRLKRWADAILSKIIMGRM